ncbi:tumor protein p53-inducible nuclear protein 2 [Pelmatolapia mariae]|uniref:tumor protein p53-inducible nuclear protein 2 n=1 Tax=Pelmatolapia mariae TaxID=158779 RepID=UPI002FE653B8
MFRTIARMLFGREEETPEDIKAGDTMEEGWHVVTHQEAGSAENQDAMLTDSQPSSSVPQGTDMETDCVADGEPTAQSGSTGTSAQSVFSSFSKPKAIAKMTQAKVLAERHHVSRNAIQRQNRVRQGVQHHSYHLQQPGCRSLSH